MSDTKNLIEEARAAYEAGVPYGLPGRLADALEASEARAERLRAVARWADRLNGLDMGNYYRVEYGAYVGLSDDLDALQPGDLDD